MSKTETYVAYPSRVEEFLPHNQYWSVVTCKFLRTYLSRKNARAQLCAQRGLKINAVKNCRFYTQNLLLIFNFLLIINFTFIKTKMSEGITILELILYVKLN